MPTEKQLFSAVDALLEQVPSDDLPPRAERKRLREAAGLSQTQIATALGTRREAVGSWEAGQREPRPPQRAAYARLLEGLAQRFPTPVAGAQPAAEAPSLSTGPAPDAVAMTNHANTQPTTTPTAPATAAPAAPPRPASTTRSTSTSRRPAAKRAPAKPAPAASSTAAAVDPRFAHGPLGVLDGDGSLYCAGGLVLDCPATTVPALVAWTLAEAKLGAPRLHRSGKDSDPLIVVTAAAAARLGLPERLEDRHGMRLPEDHKVVKQITRAKWELTRRGFGPWARVFRRGGERQCAPPYAGR